MKIASPRIGSQRSRTAFTLLEVLVASAIFFMAIFLILDVVGSSLKTARAIQHRTLSAGIIAAELSLTNQITEGSDQGDFGDLYPDYRWTTDTFEVGTNGLYEVDIAVYRRDGSRPIESALSVLTYKPLSAGAQRRGGLGF